MVLLVVRRLEVLRREALGLEVVFCKGLQRDRSRHLAILEDLPRSFRKDRRLLRLHLHLG